MKSINKSFLESLLEDLELLDERKSVQKSDFEDDEPTYESYEQTDVIEAQSLESEGYERVYHFDSEVPVERNIIENRDTILGGSNCESVAEEEKENGDILDGFTVRKAIIYSEIIKPKYF